MPSGDPTGAQTGGQGGADEEAIRVTCTNCPFSRVVNEGEGETAAEVVVGHGKERGHTLEVRSLDGEATAE